MANYKSISTAAISVLAGWEEWNGSSWVAASNIPTTGDTAYANGFNKTIDQNWTVLQIRNDVFQGTTNLGRFEILSAGITFSGDRYSNGATAPLYASFASGTSTILGRGYCLATNAITLQVVGQAGGILELEWSGLSNFFTRYGTTVSGNGNGFRINVVTIEGGTVHGLWLQGTNYIINHTGNRTDGFTPFYISGNGNRIILSGIFTGPNDVLGNTATGVYDVGQQNEIVIEGVVESTAFGPAVIQLFGNYTTNPPSSSTSMTSWITLADGATLIGTEQFPAIMGKIRVDDGAGVQWLTKSPTTADVYLYTASELTGYPPESKVEDGTVYGPSSEFEGTLQPVVIDTAQLASDLLTEMNTSNLTIAQGLRDGMGASAAAIAAVGSINVIP